MAEILKQAPFASRLYIPTVDPRWELAVNNFCLARKEPHFMHNWIDKIPGYGSRSLSMYFPEHSHDPGHPQYNDMRREFGIWQINTKNYPRIIRCEGRVPTPL